MKYRICCLVVACVMSFGLPFGVVGSAAQDPPVTNSLVARVADAVAERFYDPARGQHIAEDLRRGERAGEFAQFTNPADLATALTARLLPYDAHFRVNWAPPGSTAASSQGVPSADAGERLAARAARSAYGFQSVQMLPAGVGYIDLRSFAGFTIDDAATSRARRAADAAMALVSGAQAIIIDLRDSAGGSPAMVGYLVSYFVPADADIYNTFHARTGVTSERPIVPVSGQRLTDTPLYILVSGRTASASESFAYTLQQARRAIIIGSPTAGGANLSPIVDLGNGFSLQVAVASPENPITHANWEGRGVAPDIVTDSDQALARAQVLALVNASQSSASEEGRNEAIWALSAVNAQNSPTRRADLRDYVGNYGLRSIGLVDGHLVLRRDRRPEIALIPLARDLFAVAGAMPLQRVRFERDDTGRVEALVLMIVNDLEFRDLRRSTNGAPAH